MPRPRRVAVILAVTLAALAIVEVAQELTIATYRRHQAAKLLAAVRKLTPGVTTEAQARTALAPMAEYDTAVLYQSPESPHEISYAMYNSTAWSNTLARALGVLPVRLTLPGTLFEVSVQFTDGLVSETHIVLMQEDAPGFPHPNSASVSVRSTRFTDHRRSPYGPLPDDFAGFEEHPQSTGGFDASGKPNGFTCCRERFIQLDERATPARRTASMNFQLGCMTSYLRCKDDRAILP